MTPENMTPFWSWEEALTRHYLRSDGGFGSAPLSFLDVSGTELARAIGKGAAEARDALAEFVTIFRRQALVDALTNGYSPSPPEGLCVPGFFNFLILSCHVASAAPDVASSGDYRHRLQEILKMDHGIQTLTGLRYLWERLPKWIDAKRKTGQGYRNVVLPSYWTMLAVVVVSLSVSAGTQQIAELGREDGAKVAQNVVAGVAGVFVPVLWFAMDFQDASGKEGPALSQRNQYLSQIAARRRTRPTVVITDEVRH